MPKRYPPEFRRKVLDLVASGRRVAQVASDLDISEQCIYLWGRGTTSPTSAILGLHQPAGLRTTAGREPS
jgi:transposase-like protein